MALVETGDEDVKCLEEVISKVEENDILKPYSSILRSIKEDLQKRYLNVVLVGEYSSGKTSLVSALFDIDLPIDLLPETNTIWRFMASDSPDGKISLKIETVNGETVEFADFKEAKNFIDNNKDVIKEVKVSLKTDLKDIVLVDTPGLSSLIEKHVEVLRNALKDADVLLAVVDVNEGGPSKSMLKFLEEELPILLPTYVVLTKSDTKPPRSVEKIAKKITVETGHQVLITSAKKRKVDELKDILRKIESEKKEILKLKASRQIKTFIRSFEKFLEHYDTLVMVEISKLEIKKAEELSKFEDMKQRIGEKKKQILGEFEKIISEASEKLRDKMMRKVGYIADALYDADLKEGIEERFDTVLKKHVGEVLDELRERLNVLLNEDEIAEELAQEVDVGSDMGILIIDILVRLKEYIVRAIEFLVKIKVGKILRSGIESLLKIISKKAIESRIKQAIDDKLIPDFKEKLRELLKSIMEEHFKQLDQRLESIKKVHLNAIEAIERQKESLKPDLIRKEIIDKLRNCFQIEGG